MRQLTDSERDYLFAYWFTEPLNNSNALPERFKEGFIAGLDHRQAEVEALRAENTRLRAAAAKLLAFLQGDTTLSEIEGIEEELRRVLGEGSNG